jgi:ribosome-associated toxin RatA of RatAB toxin-antitoxin module
MSMSWAEESMEIAAPIEISFAAIVDYESFAGWQDAVDSVEVIDHTEDGLGRDVRLFIDAKVKKIDYVLRYRYQRPTRIEWDFVEGNGMRDMDGVYSFEELGPERTRATYKLGADPEIPLPGMILRRTHKQLVKRSVEDLKRAAARRHAAGEGAATPPPRGTEGAEEAATPADEPKVAGPAPPASAEGTAGEWRPKAAREPERPRPEARRKGEGGARGAGGSTAELPHALADRGLAVAEEAARVGLEVAEGALRAGKAAAAAGVDVAADLAARLERRVGDRDEDPPDRR